MFAVKKKIVPALILAVFVIAVVAIVSFSYNTGATKSSNYPSEQKQLYTYHDPIHIDGNADFTSENGVISGSGTESDPYILEGWDINASSANGIEIRNTDKHFIIQNSYIHAGWISHWSNSYDGVYFCNVTNGKIDNVISYNNYRGIYMYSSQNNNITNSYFYNNYYHGIYLSSSSNNNRITNCSVYNNSYYGILLSYSSNNNITNNVFTNDGIFIYGDSLAHYIHSIMNNTVNGKPLYYFLNQSNIIVDGWSVGQLILVNCTKFNIKNVNISNTDICIKLSYSSNNNITNCAVYNNSHYGIYLDSSSNNNNITNCAVYNNSDGIWLSSSSNNNITNCEVYNNDDGIHLSCSSNNQITSCNVYNNDAGIYLYYYSNNNQITNCTVYNNGWCGIYLYYSSNNNQITNCTVHNNYRGICLDGYLDECNYNQITNCSVYNNYVGIYLSSSSNNEIHYNNIYNNIDYGVYNWNSQYVVNATYNWWGSASGPSGVGSGTGDAVSGNVIYEPWLMNLWEEEKGPVHNIDKNTYYDTIQAAIDDADTGNTIEVSAGIYYENVVINKTLTLIGEDSNTTIIDGNGTGDVIYISADWVNVSTISIRNGYNGISADISTSNNNQITNCAIYNNSDGIYFHHSSNNTITDCIIYNNSENGIRLGGPPTNCKITNCDIITNGYGICIHYCNSTGSELSGNFIYHNNFINNSIQARDECSNTWNNSYPSGGNYWSDYTGVDANGDGMGDTPYNISGGSNQDHYPFMISSGWEEETELMPHKPIYIKGNDDFTLENGVISGSGTESNPYIIEGYNINAGTVNYPSYAGVHIENTDAYFIIRNCIIHDGYEEDIRYNYGIYFYNVTNSKIENVTSYNNYYGIFLYDSSDNNITKCIVYNNSGYGASLYYSSNSTITNCIFHNNSWYGIELYESANSTVTNCTIYNNSYGISLSRSSNCKIESCTVYNNMWYGIVVSQSSNNWIANCAVYNNSYYGIQISSSVCNVVVNCSVYNNSRYGVYFSYSQYNQIANSILYNNTYYNIYLSSSLYDQITNCVLYNSNYGAYFYSCLYDKIMDCTFYNNRYYGIYFTSSLYNQITNNSVINCSSGIYFYFSFYNQITNCALNSNSNSGGYFQFSSNNTVTRCNISANNQGFYLYSSSNNNYIYHNIFINNTNNAYDEGMNYWDCNGEGNHWGNYTGIDNNGDCIGDIPYGISGGNNKDNYPLMHEFTWWDAEMPVISLLSPCNNSVIKPGPALKFDITDDNLWRASYSMNNGVTHYFSSPYNISTNRWGDGIYNITVYAKDWGMNEISKMFIFIIDGTPPTAIIIEGNQIINATSFTMHWSTNATDIQYYEISTDNIHWINVGTNTNYTFTNLVEGFNILYVRGIDLVNNTGISSSITIVVEIPISEETAPYKEEINWLLYAGIIIAIFIALMLAGIGITSVRVVKRHKVFYPQKLKCIYCQENAEITSRDRPLLFQCPKCGGKSVIR